MTTTKTEELTMTPFRASALLRRFKHDEKMLGPNEQAAIDFAISAITALTQRPAAQTEREAFEAWHRQAFGYTPTFVPEMDGNYRAHTSRVGWSAWQARASLPAPQQATPEPVGEPDLDECPHLIWFDDHDMSPIMFAGVGARAAALQKFKDISGAWNAHLFARVAKNSLDDQYPCATLATRPAPGVPEDVAGLLCSVADNLNDMPISDEYAAKTAKKAYDLLVKYGLISTPSELLAAAQAKGGE